MCANYPDVTLDNLYDPLSMLANLRKAHRTDDKAVAIVYDRTNILNDEPTIVALS